jgi:uncharacterized ion transporter superfamily protein YfcC
MTFMYAMLGTFMGFESSIGLIPIAALLSLAIGGDLVLAAGMSVAAVAVGFGLSPVNIYTVGTGQKLAELPLFSGALLRSILCLGGIAALAWYNVRYFRRSILNPQTSLGFGLDAHGLTLSKPIAGYGIGRKDAVILMAAAVGLGAKLWGVFIYHWVISDVAALYCAVALGIGLINRNTTHEFGEIVLKGVAKVAPGAFMVGYASSIKEVLAMGRINDTIAHHSAGLLDGLPLYLAAVGMTFVQGAINFLIPSGSAQALATLPVLIPVGEVLGLTRQTTILAFQVGDGVTNLINPALGGLIAMLTLTRVPLDRWLRFIFPYFLLLLLLALVAVVVSVAIKYGPF